MGGRTYRYYNFREYEGGAFSRYLEEMAGKGWYIDGYVFDSVWRFRKGKPSKRRYNAVLMPGSSSVDIDESGDTKMFRDFVPRRAGFWNTEESSGRFFIPRMRVCCRSKRIPAQNSKLSGIL